MLLHQSYPIKPYITGTEGHKFLSRFQRKKAVIDKKLESYFNSHFISFGIFILFGMPLLILLGVALSTTIFSLLFYGITALI